MEPSRDSQIAHLQAQLVAARATQATLQNRVLQLERLLSRQQQQQQQIALSALNGLGPQALALAASGLLPGITNLGAGNSSLGAIGPQPPLPPSALALAMMHGAAQGIVGAAAAPARTSSSGDVGSPPMSASPRSSPSPPQRASPPPPAEAAEPSPAPSAPPPSLTSSTTMAADCPAPSAEVQSSPPPTAHGWAAPRRTASPLPLSGPQQVAADAKDPEANSMLQLLCTVAGRETNDGSPSSPELDVPALHALTARRPDEQAAAGRGEGEPSANDHLARALAGVGAAGSLARIRQQTLALVPPSQAAPAPSRPTWHTLEVKRPRLSR